MTEPLAIRPATTGEAPALAAMWEAFMADQNRYVRRIRRTKANRAQMSDHLAKLAGHGQVLVLAEGERLWGFAAVVVDLPRLDSHYASATVSDLYVAAGKRGRGWGKRLLAAAVALVAERGLHAVNLTVAAGNDVARTLYREAGFRPMQETLILPLDPELVRFGPRAPEA